MTSTTTHTATAPTKESARRGLLGAARVLMALSGAQLLAGSVYFTFFAPPTQGGVVTGFDWFVGLWAMGAATALLLVALVPVRTPGRRLQWARWVVGAHLVWALVKLLGYDELPVSAVVVAVDVGTLVLLWLAGRGRPGH